MLFFFTGNKVIIIGLYFVCYREQSKTMAGSKYVATVRKRSDRQKLDALPCRECAEVKHSHTDTVINTFFLDIVVCW